jgi:hypothetical protein
MRPSAATLRSDRTGVITDDLPVADRLTRRNVKVAPDAISEGNSIGPLKKLLTRPTEATLP